MALKDEIQTAVDLYARGDLEGDLQWHIDFFSFLGDNPDLQRRVGEEYYSARYIYKLLEGLRIDVSIQVVADPRRVAGAVGSTSSSACIVRER